MEPYQDLAAWLVEDQQSAKSEGSPEEFQIQVGIDDAGNLSAEGLLPGVYSFYVSEDWLDDAVRLPGRIEIGTPIAHHSAEPFDIRPYFQRTFLRVIDEQGKPVHNAYYIDRPMGESTFPNGWSRLGIGTG